jgi:hypothetical protein
MKDVKVANQAKYNPKVKKWCDTEKTSQVEFKKFFFLVSLSGQIKRKSAYQKEKGYPHTSELDKFGPSGNFHIGLWHFDHMIKKNINGR